MIEFHSPAFLNWLLFGAWFFLFLVSALGAYSGLRQGLIPDGDSVIIGVLITPISVFYCLGALNRVGDWWGLVGAFSLVLCCLYLGQFCRRLPRLIRIGLMIAPVGVIFMLGDASGLLVVGYCLLLVFLVLWLSGAFFGKQLAASELLISILVGAVFFVFVAEWLAVNRWRAFELRCVLLPIFLLGVYLGRFYQKFPRWCRVLMMLCPVVLISFVYAILENGFNGRDSKIVKQFFEGSIPESLTQLRTDEIGGGNYFDGYNMSVYRLSHDAVLQFMIDEDELREHVERAGFKQMSKQEDKLGYWLTRPGGVWFDLTYDRRSRKAVGHFRIKPNRYNRSSSRRNAQSFSSICTAASAAGYDFVSENDGGMLDLLKSIVKGYTFPEDSDSPFAGNYFGLRSMDDRELLDAAYFLDIQENLLVYDSDQSQSF